MICIIKRGGLYQNKVSLQCRRIWGKVGGGGEAKAVVYVRTVVTAIFVRKIRESKNSNPKGRC